MGFCHILISWYQSFFEIFFSYLLFIPCFVAACKGMPKRIILTHEDADHVWGNQLFPGAEIIAHRSVLPERMKQVAEPKDTQQLQHGVGNVIKNFVIKVTHPGLQLHKLSGKIAEKIG